MSKWPIYRGNTEPHDAIKDLPPAPRWRRFRDNPLLNWDLEKRSSLQNDQSRHRGETFYARDSVVEQINAALFLRRPLLVTGHPGTGKSSLAHAVAYELKLGPVLEWPINSRSTVKDALYRYDAISRLQEASLQERGNLKESESSDIVQFLRLGPLGTALVGSQFPRVLLIDEIDKSDIDLPNDLLTILEEGWFEIPELVRLAKQSSKDWVSILIHDSEVEDEDAYVKINEGRVQCQAFPFIVITSNGERVLPPAFLRRCIQLRLPDPSLDDLEIIVKKHFDPAKPDSVMAKYEDAVSLEEIKEVIRTLVERYEKEQKGGLLATDQLLNAIYLAHSGVDILQNEQLLKTVFEHLSRNVRRP